MSILINNNVSLYGAYTHDSKKVSDSGKSEEETLEEYKYRIRQEIDKIPFDSSHRKITETLVISEEGYQAMKEDPEYEKWVFEHIKENRSVNLSIMTNRKDYLSGTDYEYIGATKEECWGEGYNNWDYSKDSSAKKSKKEKAAYDATDYTELWQNARYRRECNREERDKEYFSGKNEITQLNRRLADTCYKENFLFEND